MTTELWKDLCHLFDLTKYICTLKQTLKFLLSVLVATKKLYILLSECIEVIEKVFSNTLGCCFKSLKKEKCVYYFNCYMFWKQFSCGT